MSQPQFRLGRLLALLIPIGVALAALIRPNRGSAAVLSSLLVVSLLTAILGVVLRRGRARGFWLGFALFGWSLLLLLVTLGRNGTVWNLGFDVFEITDLVLQTLGAARALDRNEILVVFRSWGRSGWDAEIRVTLSAMVLAFAYLGGRIGRYLAGDEPAVATLDAAAAQRARIAATR